MKQNGFTLIELIGVVAIIALVMVVAVPQVMSTLTNSSVKQTEAFENDLELAAESYVENNWQTFKVEYQKYQASHSNSNQYCIPLSTLISNGYIENTDIDPSTNKAINFENKYILLHNTSGALNRYKFSFEYIDTMKDKSTICTLWEENYEKNN